MRPSSLKTQAHLQGSSPSDRVGREIITPLPEAGFQFNLCWYPTRETTVVLVEGNGAPRCRELFLGQDREIA